LVIAPSDRKEIMMLKNVRRVIFGLSVYFCTVWTCLWIERSLRTHHFAGVDEIEVELDHVLDFEKQISHWANKGAEK
jgi:hypothetical protein